jgi:hypothetical protein
MCRALLLTATLRRIRDDHFHFFDRYCGIRIALQLVEKLFRIVETYLP